MSQVDELAKYGIVLQDTTTEERLNASLQSQKRKPLPKEKQMELIQKIQTENDFDALEEMLLSNLGLVHEYLKKVNINNIKHIQYDDLLYEGINGLKKAIAKFDLESGNAFSTYAYYWVKQSIIRFIQNNKTNIRIPISLQETYKHYNQLINQYYSKNHCYPSDQYILDTLNISEEVLSNCKYFHNYSEVSLDKAINNEKSESTLGDFISNNEDAYQELHDQYDQKLLYYTLKQKLNAREYYIIYWYFLSDPKLLQKEIAKNLNMSESRVVEIKNYALKKLRCMIKEMQNGFSQLLHSQSINRHILKNIDRVRIAPLEPKDIFYYSQLKEQLTLREYSIVYYLNIYDIVLTEDEVCEKLLLMPGEFHTIYQSALNKIEAFNKNFQNNENIKYNSDILNVDLKPDSNDFLYQIYAKYHDISFHDFLNYHSDFYQTLSKHQQILIENYLPHQYTTPSPDDLKMAEQEINLHLLNLINPPTIPLTKLYSVYLSHKNLFSLEKQHFIECYIFHKLPEEQFQKCYPNFSYQNKKTLVNFYIIKLENIYLQVDGIMRNKFYLSNNEIQKILENNQYPISQQYKEILKLYYGIGCKRHSIIDISKMIGENYQVTHDRLFEAKARVLRIYLHQPIFGIIRDGEKYRPYLENCQYNFTPETRSVLIKHLLEQKDYQQIAQENGLSTTRISNIITDGIRKLDFYRFHIISEFTLTQNELEQFIENHAQYKKTRNLLYMRYFEGKDIETIVQFSKETRHTINQFYANFEKAFYRDITHKTSLSMTDLQNAIAAHDSDSILNSFEKEILSYKQGIISTYNPNGEKQAIPELSKKYQITIQTCKGSLDRINQKLQKQKLGYIQPEFGFYTREEMEELLQDRHLPISDFEKELIQQLKELNGFPHLSVTQLAQKYQMTEGSIKRRYLRAILNIKKYQINEISGIYSYEEDIKPNLKYFTPYQQKILIKLYKEKTPINQICQEFHQTKNNITNEVQNMNFNLEMILRNYKDAHKFNFDFANQYIHSNTFTLPVGNHTIIDVYDAFFGTDNSPGDSIDKMIMKLNLPYAQSTIQKQLTKFLNYNQKKCLGIETPEYPSYKMISDYYQSHYHMLPEKEKQMLEKYLSMNKNQLFTLLNRLPQDMLYNIITYHSNDLPFSFQKSDKQFAIKLLLENQYHLSSQTKHTLKNYYQIDSRMFMSGKEKRKALNILEELEIRKKEEEKEEKINQLKKAIS